MNELIKLGKNIRTERNRLHLTQGQLAALIDIQPNHISNIENGKVEIRFKTLVAIMKALEVPFEKLYDISDEI